MALHVEELLQLGRGLLEVCRVIVWVVPDHLVQTRHFLVYRLEEVLLSTFSLHQVLRLVEL